jgi:hypothetical protein
MPKDATPSARMSRSAPDDIGTAAGTTPKTMRPALTIGKESFAAT